MAKDDYHVIVYQILSYLYTQLKAGNKIDIDRISSENQYFIINEKYWEYIIMNLHKDGLIYGLTIKETRDVTGVVRISINNLDQCQITPKGIEYLTDNSFMSKAKEFFKDAKSIVPFI